MKLCTVSTFIALCAFLFIAQTHTSVVKKRAADPEQSSATTAEDLEQKCKMSQQALTRAFRRMWSRLKTCNKQLASEKQRQSNCTGLSAYHAAQNALSRSLEERLRVAIELKNSTDDEEVEEEDEEEETLLMHQYESRLVTNETMNTFLRDIPEREQQTREAQGLNELSTLEDQEVCPTTFRVSNNIN